MNNRAATLLFVLTLVTPALAAAVPNEPLTIAKSEIYTAKRLRATPLLGVRLGMSLAQADKTLTKAGFELRFRNTYKYEGGQRADGNHMFFKGGQHLQLDYVGDGGRRSVVVGLTTMEPLTDYGVGGPRAWRISMIARFGLPSWWQHWIDNGVLQDRMVWVSTPAMLDDTRLQNAWSCSIDWRCTSGGAPKDCRSAVRDAGGPVLEVSFGPGYVRYAWTDYAREYEALMRTPAFRDQDRSGAVCPIPMIH